MAQQWQLRRGTTEQNNTFTGAIGEVTVDTTTHELRVHDGTTAGGYTIGESIITNKISGGILENAQNLKFNDKTLKAGSVVYFPNGSTFDPVTLQSDVYISDSIGLPGLYVHKYAFITPEGTLYKIHVDNVFAGPSTPTVTAETNIWYDTSNKVFKKTTDTGTTWETVNLSLPVAVYRLYKASPSSSSTVVILHTFNNIGFVGLYAYVLPGLKCLIPNEKNSDGSQNYITYTTNEVKGSLVTANQTEMLVIRQDGLLYGSNGFNAENRLGLAVIRTGDQFISTLKQYSVLEIENHNTIKQHEVIYFQAPTSTNNYTWFRLYADGWVEQGGKTTSATSTVTLPIEMADTNYHIQATPNGTGGASYYASFGVQTSTTTVTIYGNLVGSWWQVSGMAA